MQLKIPENKKAVRQWFVMSEGTDPAGVEKSFRTLEEARSWCLAKGYPVRVYRQTKRGLVFVEEHELQTMSSSKRGYRA